MEHIRKAFDAVATKYDAQREYVIPEMRQFYSALVWAAESPSASPAILDVGAGTGLLSALLLEKYPGATITLLDISEKMLAIARERFSGCNNVVFRAGDYSRVDLGGAVRPRLLLPLDPPSRTRRQAPALSPDLFRTRPGRGICERGSGCGGDAVLHRDVPAVLGRFS